jgi:hypothetical protein
MFNLKQSHLTGCQGQAGKFSALFHADNPSAGTQYYPQKQIQGFPVK